MSLHLVLSRSMNTVMFIRYTELFPNQQESMLGASESNAPHLSWANASAYIVTTSKNLLKVVTLN